MENENRTYYPIDEGLARRAKEMSSFSEYELGSKTEEYRDAVNVAYDIAERIEEKSPKDAERAWHIAELYARRMAAYVNNDLRIGCMCPSVMITGSGNFPTKKKEKQVAAWAKNYESYKSIQRYLEKLRGIERGYHIIRSDDEGAIERLEDRLTMLEEEQARMKAVNAYYRKHKSLSGCSDISVDDGIRMEERLQGGRQGAPYPTWALANNNANIRATRERLEGLKKAKSRTTTRTEYGSFTLEENVEDMRFRFYFDGKPDEEVRDLLKYHAFKWSPKAGAWQRQITDNARRAVEAIIDNLQQMEAAE